MVHTHTEPKGLAEVEGTSAGIEVGNIVDQSVLYGRRCAFPDNLVGKDISATIEIAERVTEPSAEPNSSLSIQAGFETVAKGRVRECQAIGASFVAHHDSAYAAMGLAQIVVITHAIGLEARSDPQPLFAIVRDQAILICISRKRGVQVQGRSVELAELRILRFGHQG